MKVLFVKDSLVWPRSSGHDVHCFHMMEGLIHESVQVALLTAKPCQPEAIDGLNLCGRWTYDDLQDVESDKRLPRLQEKFCGYWGIERSRLTKIANLVQQESFDAIVVVGLSVLPYLAMVPQEVKRVWYAADEWLLHHWSQFRLTNRSTWHNLKDGMIKGVYEYAFTSCTDRVWVVSNKDASTTKWVMPRSAVDVIANGVDAGHFDPSKVESTNVETGGLVFWGRLDFGPNLDAIQWFCENVWSKLVRQRPDISWTVYGFQAGDAVRKLAEEFQFKLVPDLPDLRAEILRHQVVVLPFVSGAGIKNKFLEAAAMARPIVASPRALNGVELHNGQPCLIAASSADWIQQITRLVDSESEQKRQGENARKWVIEHYSWEKAAKLAVRSLSNHP